MNVYYLFCDYYSYFIISFWINWILDIFMYIVNVIVVVLLLLIGVLMMIIDVVLLLIFIIILFIINLGKDFIVWYIIVSVFESLYWNCCER